MKKNLLLSIMIICIFTVSSFAVDTWRVSRNIRDMQRLVDDGIFFNRDEIKEILGDTLSMLREPTGNGTYRYADWRKTSYTDSNMYKMKVEYSSQNFQTMQPRYENLHAVKVSVPKKWGFFHGNDPIYVKDILVKYTTIEGERKTLSRRIEKWFNTKDEQTFELRGIAKNAEVTVHASCKDGEKNDCALYIYGVKAELHDSFSNPYYDSVSKLKELEKDIQFIQKDEAQKLLADALQPIDGSYGGYVDHELISRLENIQHMLPDQAARAQRLLDRLVSDLEFDGYNYRVIRNLKRVVYLLENGGYNDIREAQNVLRRTINDLRSAGRHFETEEQ